MIQSSTGSNGTLQPRDPRNPPYTDTSARLADPIMSHTPVPQGGVLAHDHNDGGEFGRYTGTVDPTISYSSIVSGGGGSVCADSLSPLGLFDDYVEMHPGFMSSLFDTDHGAPFNEQALEEATIDCLTVNMVR